MKSIDSHLYDKLARSSPRQLVLVFICLALIFYGLHHYLTHRKSASIVPHIPIKQSRIKSPFAHTLGFIRWNSAHLSRIPLMEKYRPFFSELHYSIPDFVPKLNYTADGLVSIHVPYKMVGDTMALILKDHPQVHGVLFFHFDAWINPFRFDQMNFEHIWFPDSSLPPFRCVTDRKGWDWWAWDQGFHQIAKTATEMVAKNYSGRYITNKDVFCGGWSDIYYVPRRFFRAFIELSHVFHAVGSFHEVAIPTILNIIDLTYRLTPHHTVITRMNDCWGHCCASGATSNDVQTKRCGHRLDLTNEEVKNKLVEILESEARFLNRPILRRALT